MKCWKTLHMAHGHNESKIKAWKENTSTDEKKCMLVSWGLFSIMSEEQQIHKHKDYSHNVSLELGTENQWNWQATVSLIILSIKDFCLCKSKTENCMQLDRWNYYRENTDSCAVPALPYLRSILLPVNQKTTLNQVL